MTLGKQRQRQLLRQVRMTEGGMWSGEIWWNGTRIYRTDPLPLEDAGQAIARAQVGVWDEGLGDWLRIVK